MVGSMKEIEITPEHPLTEAERQELIEQIEGTLEEHDDGLD